MSLVNRCVEGVSFYITVGFSFQRTKAQGFVLLQRTGAEPSPGWAGGRNLGKGVSHVLRTAAPSRARWVLSKNIFLLCISLLLLNFLLSELLLEGEGKKKQRPRLFPRKNPLLAPPL